MPGLVSRATLIASLLAVVASRASAQLEGMHHHGDIGSWWSVGASGILYATRVDPGVYSRTLAEAYLTQPLLHAHVMTPGGGLALRATVDFEGSTLARGELTPGAYGEGFIDRRHPHTYLHELIATATTPGWFGADASLSVGKGFAPFGTDDPMSRPFVRYPVNHHLAQILERAMIVGAVRWRPLVIETAWFNGDEPESPTDAPNSRSRGDSRSTRITLRPAAKPLTGTELQWSFARLHSPESPTGYGFDHHRQSASARYERTLGVGHVYALAEWAQTVLEKSGRRAFTLHSTLGEASVTRGIIRLSARYEQTVRPEDERLTNVFRTIYPSAEVQILGTTRFDVLSLGGEARWALAGVSLAPFTEVSLLRANETLRPAAFVPRDFYGSDRQTQLSFGVRLRAGSEHGRMGRYGVAANRADMHHNPF